MRKREPKLWFLGLIQNHFDAKSIREISFCTSYGLFIWQGTMDPFGSMSFVPSTHNEVVNHYAKFVRSQQ
jgi:hypothetical protein